MQKAILIKRKDFDIPGVNYGNGFLLRPMNQQEAFAIEKVLDSEYLLIAITNQSDPGENWMDEAALCAAEAHLTQLLLLEDISPEQSEFVSNYSENVKKMHISKSPASNHLSKVLVKAEKDFNLDIRNSWAICDTLNEIEACTVVGCRSILIGTDKQAGYATDSINAKAFFIMSDMDAALAFIHS